MGSGATVWAVASAIGCCGLDANRLDTDAKSLNQALSSLDRGWRDLLTEGCPRH